jgi:hypothetical protein
MRKCIGWCELDLVKTSVIHLVVADGLYSPFVLFIYRSGMPLIKLCPIDRFIIFHYTSLCFDWATDWVTEESWFDSGLGAMKSSVLHNFRPAVGPIQLVPAVPPPPPRA